MTPVEVLGRIIEAPEGGIRWVSDVTAADSASATEKSAPRGLLKMSRVG